MRRTVSPMVTAFRSMTLLIDCRPPFPMPSIVWERDFFMFDQALLTKLLCVAFVAAVMKV